MKCPNCNQPLSVLRQAEIMQAEADLSAQKLKPVRLPDGLRCCDDCMGLPFDDVVVH